MKIKICSFEEAREICEEMHYGRDEMKAYGIPKEWDGWEKLVRGERCSEGISVDNYILLDEFCTIVEEYMSENDIIHYGTIVTDDELRNETGEYVRIRIITYEGDLYYHKMVNGNIVEYKRLVMI